MSESGPAGASVVTVGTLNVRNTADRWRSRRTLLLRQLAALDPALLGLQEVRHFPDQAGWIAHQASLATGNGRGPYTVHRTYKTGLLQFWEGIALMTRLPVLERDSLELGGQHRVANLVRVRLPDGSVLDAYNTHLAVGDEALRRAQASRILEWMARRPGTAQVLMGDMNARPTAGSIALFTQGLRSAHVVAHGAEPERTVGTPLRGGAAGPGAVIDYVFVNDRVEVHAAWVTFDEVDPADPHLSASDHYGVAASISVLAD